MNTHLALRRTKRELAGIPGRLCILGTMALQLTGLASLTAGEAPAPPAGPGSTSPFRETSPGVLTLGQVTLDKGARTVRFPVQVNLRSNVVEYAVVTSHGKTHESLFKTDVDPVHVHLAMLLLGAKSTNTNLLGGDLKAAPPGERIQVEAAWQEKERAVRRPLEDLIVFSTNLQQTLPPGPWLYNGSHIDRGRFMAALDGSIISIQEDANALVNNPRPDRFNDDIHWVNSPALPRDGVPIELILTLPR